MEHQYEREYTTVKCGTDENKVEFGLPGTIPIIAGPCTVETKEQIIATAQAVKMAGAKILRGGVFKPRTSPYSFQGLGEVGLEYLIEAKKITGLPVITEIVDASQLDLYKDVDILQVGSRNMQNYQLLKELGKNTDKPIMLKRGFGNTIDEFLNSAEYIIAYGNSNIIFCDRGIRTFENGTRFTLDIGSIPLLRQKTGLPVIVDPSHAAGRRDLVASMAKAAVVAGAQGLMIEVHDNPELALCDGDQAITSGVLNRIINDAEQLVSFQ